MLADGNSQLTVVREIHTSMIMNSYLIVTKLKAGFIAGMDFMKENKVLIDITNHALILPDNHIVSFNSVPGNPKVSLLRVDVSNIVLPGESLTLPTPINFFEESDIAVEPRENSYWPSPCRKQ